MPDLFMCALAEAADSPVQEVVEQVGDIIDAAGSHAGDILSGLPVLTTKLLMAGLTIFIGVILIRIGRRMISSIVRMRGQKGMKTVQQLNTVKSLVTSIFNYIMYFIIVTIALSIFGVNVSSLLAVAGVSGIAIAFGSQTLIKDFISGMFLWGEGRINVGDIVTISGQTGIVEEIALRCGYASPEHFSRQFKKYTGISPDRWRRHGAGSEGNGSG